MQLKKKLKNDYKMIIHPDNRIIDINGKRFKDNIPNYRKLSSVLEFPGPINRYYNWPSIYEAPMKEQILTVDFLLRHRRGYCLNAIGTGKTLCMDWMIDFLIKEKEIQRALIIAPLSTLQTVHAESLYFSLPHLNYGVLHGSKDKRLKELAKDRDVYIMNFDGLRVVGEEIYKRKDINCVFIDEIAILRNRHKHSLKELQKGRKPTLHQTVEGMFGPHRKDILIWGFTGSPTPRAPTDVYGQARIINPDTLPQKRNFKTGEKEPIAFSRFRELVMYKPPDSEYTWLPQEGWEKICADVLQPSIRFERQRSTGAPLVETYEIEMSSQQKQLYNQMIKQLRIELAGKEIHAVNEGVKINKLVQIASGAVYDEAGIGHTLDYAPRLKVLKELIDAAHPEHVLVFLPFRNMLDTLKKDLTREYGTCVEYVDSDVNNTTRSTYYKRFQHGDLRVLLSIPKCMAHGLNLHYQCSTIIWWSGINSFETYEQACGRIDRTGQEKQQLIIHMQGSPAERKMFRKLKNREDAQGILLDIIKAGKV